MQAKINGVKAVDGGENFSEVQRYDRPSRGPLSCSTGRSVALGTAGVGEGFAIHGDKTHVTNTENVDEFQPSYSPDGKQIAYTGYKGNAGELYAIDVGGGGKTSLTDTGYNVDEYMPSWGSRP